MLLNLLTNVLLVLLAIFVVFVLVMVRNHLHWKLKGIDFVTPYPVIGNLVRTCQGKESLGEYARRMYNECKGRYLGLYFFDNPVLLIKDLEIAKDILVKNSHVFPHRNFANDVPSDPIGTCNLFFLHAPASVTVRKKLTPCFTTGKIRSLFLTTQKNCQQLLQYMEKKRETSDVIDTEEMFVKFVINSVIESFLGVDAEAFTNEDSPFLQFFKENAAGYDLRGDIVRVLSIVSPDLVQLLNLHVLPKSTIRFVVNFYEKISKERIENKISRPDLIEMIMEAIADENLKNVDKNKWLGQISGTLFAAYETSTISLTFLIYELAKHQEIQEKARKEAFEALQKDGEFNYDNVKTLEYLEKVFFEATRKYPALPFLDRQSVMKYLIPGTDIVLDKKTSVIIPTLGIHYDPKIYPDPEKFDPERFSKENEQYMQNCSFLSFGDGFRSCIGRRYAIANAKIVTASILTTYRVELCKDTSLSVDPKHFLLQFNSAVNLKYTKL